MNIQKLAGKIGTTATISMEKIMIDVRINDVRWNFGRTEFLVTPIAGKGEQWVNADRICEGE